MKKLILSITIAACTFCAGVVSAQTMTYCVLNGVATYCPNVIVPPAVQPMIAPGQYDPPPINGEYDMRAMRSGYNNTATTAPTTVNGEMYGTDGRDVAARRRAYTGASDAVRKSAEETGVVSLYPNPVIGSTRIVLNTVTLSPVAVDVVDMNGNRVRSYDFAAGIYNLDIDMSSLPPALYSVRVYGKDVPMQNLKVVKN